MASKKMSGRITAAVISSMMTASMFTAPISYQFTNQLSQIVSAATNTELGVELEAADSGSKDPAPNKTRVAVPKDATEVTFNFESDSTDDLSLGIYGLELYGIDGDDDSWWADASADISIKGGKGSYTYKIPAKYQGKVKKVCLGLWYPKSGVTATITSVETDGTDTGTTPGGNVLGPQDAPKTENEKSGSCSFKDNGDGTATISATLTSEVKIDDSTQFDIVLTQGHDEETYAEEGITLAEVEEQGLPINSHKFSFADFGFETAGDLDGVTFQSFNYTITCEEDMAKFQYGGGINAESQSPADTEYVKGKDGYWYNDQGDQDVEKYGAELDTLGIKYHGAYTVENAGSYAEIVWDVPKDVQPYVDKNQTTNNVSIQYWYSNALNAEEGKEYDAIPEVHLTSASCTYTKTLTVPYNKTKNVKMGKTLTPGSDSKQLKYMLGELGLENSRDKISAVKFNLKSSADIKKLTSGVGISVGGDKQEEFEGWYMSPDITILEPAKDEIELMWIVPVKIRDYVDFISALGNILYGTWYTGEDNASVTLESMDFYEYISNEKEDLTASPENMEVEVGETANIKTNIPGCTFKSSSSSIASVDENGAVTGVSEGLTTITITTPEGQEATIKVIVTDNSTSVTTAPVTTAKPVTTTVKPTTTKPVTTAKPVTTTKPFDPHVDVDWPNVLYGDVNLDTYVDTADLVMLNMYILDPETNNIKNATARENAQCYYDAPEKLIDSYDASILLNYIAMLIKYEEIGPKDKINVPAIRTE